MPPQDWNMTYMCLQRRFQPQITMGPSNCHLPAEVRPKLANPFQLCQDRTTCWTEVDAEQWRKIENNSSVTTLNSLVDFTLGPLSKCRLTIQQFCDHLIASSFHEMCCARYQGKNKDISKFAIDLINIKRQEEHHVYACLCGVNHLFDVQYLVWIKISCCPSTSGTPASVPEAIIFLHVLCNGKSRRRVKP